MKIKKSIHMRVIIGLEKGLKIAAQKAWGIVSNEPNKQGGKNA